MSVTMDGLYVDGEKVVFHPEDILTDDPTAYTEEIGTAVNAWMEENVTGGEQVTDTTLTLSGVPADAKATGDKIGALGEDFNYFKSLKIQPNDAAFFNSYNTVDLLNISDSDLSGGDLHYRTRNTFYFTAPSDSGCSIYIPLNLVSGKTYTLRSVFTLTATHSPTMPNFRLYNGDTYVKDMASNTDYSISPGGSDNYRIRVYLHSGDSIAIASVDCRETGEYDYINPVYIDTPNLSYKNVIPVTWADGGMNGDGTINTVANIYRTPVGYKLLAGESIGISSGAKLSSFKIYNNEPIVGTSVPASSLSNETSYTASATVWVVLVGAKVYDAQITTRDVVINTNLENEIASQRATKTIVTQESIVNSVTKEVIETQIETVEGARNASNYGVLPDNDAATNTTNMQTLLNNGGTIIVDVPGTYLFNGLTVYSNTELICGEQVVFSKQNSTGSLIINSGATTREYNTDIRIKGLTVAVNGNDSYPFTPVVGLRGILAFFYVKNLVLEDITCTDIGSNNYFIHIAKFEHVLINNAYLTGNKDGIHASGGNHLKITNCKFATNDDPIALNAHDYLTGCPNLNWIKDVIIENCTDMDNGRLNGYFIRILGGAWLDWESGKQYKHGDAVVASNGYVYRLSSALDGTLKTSTVEPTHTTYTGVTESDSCLWYLIQKDTVYNCGVENLSVSNCYIERAREICFNFHYDNDNNSRSLYPGANAVPQKNIIFNNVICKNANGIRDFVYARTPVDLIRINNCKFAVTNIMNATKDFTEVVETITQLLIHENDLREVTNLIAGSADRKYRINANMNVKDTALTCTGGTVTFVQNDITA